MSQLKKHSPLKQEVYKFILVGILNTAIGLSTIFLGLYLGFGNLMANIFGYAVGLVSAYLLNKYFVFKTKKNAFKKRELFFFIMTFALSYLANIMVLYFLLHFGAHPYLAQTFAMGTYSVINFLLNKFITFNDGNSPHLTQNIRI